MGKTTSMDECAKHTTKHAKKFLQTETRPKTRGNSRTSLTKSWEFLTLSPENVPGGIGSGILYPLSRFRRGSIPVLKRSVLREAFPSIRLFHASWILSGYHSLSKTNSSTACLASSLPASFIRACVCVQGLARSAVFLDSSSRGRCWAAAGLGWFDCAQRKT